MENPNTSPAFIRSVGWIGVPVDLTNQVCTRDAPGNVPMVAYDSQATYAFENGAFVENIILYPTGSVAKSSLVLFVKFNDATTPVWKAYIEIDLPALASQSATAKPAGYPLRADMIEQIYQIPPRVGTLAYPTGIRLNGSSRNYQVGFALTTAIGSLPLTVWMKGGGY